MPPRHAYWTIIAGGQPTAFRAAERDELVPTLKQLQSRHPDATLMWFARGKLWPTKEAASFALRQERSGEPRERRGREWRPGGQHKDPRDRFNVPRDVKRKRFAERLRRERREEDRPPDRRPWRQKGDRLQDDRPSLPREDRPQGDRPFRPKGPRPHGERPFKPKSDRSTMKERPAAHKPRSGDGGPFTPKGGRPAGGGFKPRGGPRGGGGRGR
jgi:hypothetical protein